MRLAVICDLLEESWPSMDLVAEMLLMGLQAEPASAVHAERVCPTMVRRFSRLPFLGKRPAAHNTDRLLNRFWDYPRRIRRRFNDFDFFHICDHSYAHLVHGLPRERTGVYCHDLDAFRCLLEPERERRPRWFLGLARRVLRGLQQAALVFCGSQAVREQISRHGIMDAGRIIYAPYGVSSEFTSHAVQGDSPLPACIGSDAPFLLHVGSCIPRKRIDVLLDTFAGLREACPELRLVQVGGQWTKRERGQMASRQITLAVTQLRGLDRHTLAALYRRAAVVLQPSDSEGFGLPVIEALACGAVVVASAIPVLREVGGNAAIYCPPGDVPAWIQAIDRLLRDPSSAPPRPVRLAQARRFSWAAHAQTILEAYQRLGAPSCAA